MAQLRGWAPGACVAVVGASAAIPRNGRETDGKSIPPHSTPPPETLWHKAPFKCFVNGGKVWRPAVKPVESTGSRKPKSLTGVGYSRGVGLGSLNEEFTKVSLYGYSFTKVALSTLMETLVKRQLLTKPSPKSP